MKFAFSLSAVIEADCLETALKIVSGHISRVQTHVANERSLNDCGAKFTISQVSDDTPDDDLVSDPVVNEHGPIALTLDPESPEGIEHAAQIAAETEAQKESG
jgi:hypothetical protein